MIVRGRGVEKREGQRVINYWMGECGRIRVTTSMVIMWAI